VVVVVVVVVVHALSAGQVLANAPVARAEAATRPVKSCILMVGGVLRFWVLGRRRVKGVWVAEQLNE